VFHGYSLKTGPGLPGTHVIATLGCITNRLLDGTAAACSPMAALPKRGLSILRELLAKFGNIFLGWRPVHVARIAVEHQRAGLQLGFEFFVAKFDCLVVVVRTYNLELDVLAHVPSA
jgi:hypothetical protein